MDKQYLLNTAEKLIQPSPDAAKEFSDKRDAITLSIKKALDTRTDLEESDKARNNGMDRNDHTYHMKHMEGLFMAYSPEEYVNTTLWTARMYSSHGFNLAHWKSILTVIVSVLKQELSPSAYAEIYPFYDWMITNIPNFTLLSKNTEG